MNTINTMDLHDGIRELSQLNQAITLYSDYTISLEALQSDFSVSDIPTLNLVLTEVTEALRLPEDMFKLPTREDLALESSSSKKSKLGGVKAILKDAKTIITVILKYLAKAIVAADTLAKKIQLKLFKGKQSIRGIYARARLGLLYSNDDIAKIPYNQAAYEALDESYQYIKEPRLANIVNNIVTVEGDLVEDATIDDALETITSNTNTVAEYYKDLIEQVTPILTSLQRLHGGVGSKITVSDMETFTETLVQLSSQTNNLVLAKPAGHYMDGQVHYLGTTEREGLAGLRIYNIDYTHDLADEVKPLVPSEISRYNSKVEMLLNMTTTNKANERTMAVLFTKLNNTLLYLRDLVNSDNYDKQDIRAIRKFVISTGNHITSIERAIIVLAADSNVLLLKDLRKIMFYCRLSNDYWYALDDKTL